MISCAGRSGEWILARAIPQQVEPFLIRDLTATDLRLHREAMRVGGQMDFRREATFRAAKTLSLSPPFAPAA